MSNALSDREKWQEEARVTGDEGEDRFNSEIAKVLPDYYYVGGKEEARLGTKTLVKELTFYPLNEVSNKPQGIELDGFCYNPQTNMRFWHETKTGINGANATQERAMKFALPSMWEDIKDWTKRVKDQDTPDVPVMMIFQGPTFMGSDNHAAKVRAEVARWLRPMPKYNTFPIYFIMNDDYSNINEVADKIVELIG